MPIKAAVLSIDGGGIKGIIPAMILAEIEEKTGKKISQLFDFIGGTSTGGILTLALTKPSEEDKNKPQFSAKDLISLYTIKGETIFKKRIEKKLNRLEGFQQNALKAILSKFSPEVVPEDLFASKYTRNGKETVIKDYLGNTYINEALTEVLVTSYATNLRRPFFFTSNSRKEKKYRTSETVRVVCDGYRMRDAALATSAAPTYFKPYPISAINHLDQEYTLVDGGVVANNPTSIAIIEALNSYEDKTKQNASLNELLVVSLGTGRKARRLNIQEMAEWGQIKWVEPLIDIVFNGQSEVVDYQMEQLLSTTLQRDSQSKQYYRFQPQYSETKEIESFSVSGDSLTYVNDDMDDVSKDNILNLLRVGNRLIDMERDNLNLLCKQLIELFNHRNLIQ